jgi:hypothetical protein
MSVSLRRGLCVAILLVLAAGCAMDPAAKPWWTLREANLRQLQSGKATKADVQALLGKPISEMSFPRQGEDVWDIRFVDGTIVMHAWVYYDTHGVYKYYTAQPDPAYNSKLD